MEKTDDHAWEQLISAARKAPRQEEDVHPPLGFATRVVARAFAVQNMTLLDALDSLSYRVGGPSLLFGGILLLASTIFTEFSISFSQILNLSWIF